MTHYLLLIGDREALGWVLAQQRMAFPDFQRSEVRALRPGDTLFLYTTRGCFGNPTRDRGRVIAKGAVVSAVASLDVPVSLAARTYPVGCKVDFPTAVAWSDGVELAPLVSELDAFEGVQKHWSVRLRRPLLRLTAHDASLINKLLSKHRRYPLNDILADYAKWWLSSPGRTQ